MDLPSIHLAAPAGSCRSFLADPDIQSIERLIELVQEGVGPGYRVTLTPALFDFEELDQSCGRRDDPERAADLEKALADDRTAAIVVIRGGAWLTRILPRIDFEVLANRTRPVTVIGFSEITTLVNIVAGYRQGVGIYDISPAFFPYSLRQYARSRASDDGLNGMTPKAWARSRFLDEFRGFFRDVVSMIQGRGSSRSVTVRLRRGRLEDETELAFVGGNLSVFPALLCPRYERFADPRGCWVALEDFNDRMSRHDRWLAHLTLAGFWDRCEGVLLGDFHEGTTPLTEAMLDLLTYHLPTGWDKPVAVTDSIGHIWPMAPLPLRTALTARSIGEGRYELTWPTDPAAGRHD
ncbi:MAG: LD-carboxypeptidase [Phycisphaerae bacterium]